MPGPAQVTLARMAPVVDPNLVAGPTEAEQGKQRERLARLVEVRSVAKLQTLPWNEQRAETHGRGHHVQKASAT